MQVTKRLIPLLFCVAAMAYAETWTGKLIDANCAQQQQKAACNATASTTSFALRVGQTMYKFDADGNRKASEALEKSQSGAERSKNPNMPEAGVTATVNGTLSDNEIQVESIEVQ